LTGLVSAKDSRASRLDVIVAENRRVCLELGRASAIHRSSLYREAHKGGGGSTRVRGGATAAVGTKTAVLGPRNTSWRMSTHVLYTRVGGIVALLEASGGGKRAARLGGGLDTSFMNSDESPVTLALCTAPSTVSLLAYHPPCLLRT